MEVCTAEICVAKVRMAEVYAAEVYTPKVSTTKVCTGEVRPYFRILLSPQVPFLDATPKPLYLFFVCHECFSSLFAYRLGSIVTLACCVGKGVLIVARAVARDASLASQCQG